MSFRRNGPSRSEGILIILTILCPGLASVMVAAWLIGELSQESAMKIAIVAAAFGLISLAVLVFAADVMVIQYVAAGASIAFFGFAAVIVTRLHVWILLVPIFVLLIPS